MSEKIVVASGITKRFVMAGEVLEVLQGVDLDVLAGEILAIQGASGVGKSTLLHILGTLDRPSGGVIRFAEGNVLDLSDRELASFRNRHIGFVFQFHHLLPEFTALENVMMPGLIAAAPRREARLRAAELLATVGLQDRARHKPQELSGGEQQRVAVARSLFQSPRLVIADEPSGNLDPGTAERLHELVYTLAKERGVAWVIATHNENLARIADRRGRLVGGRMRTEAAGLDSASAARPPEVLTE
ncbi:MAG: ABC transporter ATP-binding protein [Candidatus Eisenbacteria bacterium]|nr:ABC transporter ATP-binding protein [Candidatus Eisenbacteria bacterium]